MTTSIPSDLVPLPGPSIPPNSQNTVTTTGIDSLMGSLVNNPSLPAGTEMTPALLREQPNQNLVGTGSFLTNSGASPATTAANTSTASAIDPRQAVQMTASTIGNQTPTMEAQQGTVSQQAQATAQQGNVSPQSLVTAQQGTVSQQSLAQAAQGEAAQVQQTAKRELETLNKKLGAEEARNPGTIERLARRLGYTGPVSGGQFDQWLWNNPNARSQLDAMFGSEVVSGSAVDQSKVNQALSQDTAAQNVMSTTLNDRLTKMEADQPGTMQRLAKQLGFPKADTGWAKGEFDQWLYNNPDKREQLGAMVGANEADRTMAGQMQKLTSNFDAKNPPPWAAGAIRGVSEVMAARGISASSLAGQALVQAALESAMPIAQNDAAVFERAATQNLSNRQAMALQKAQMRAQFLGQEFDQNFQTRVLNASKVSEIANLNFTAEQTVALENARLMQSINLANLSNRQAVAIANAATYANMDQANLANRQQAAVANAATSANMDQANLNNRQQAMIANAKAFLDMDMANLSNRQQAAAINQAARQQSMLSDQAAENAARQFNATSANQTNQFYDELRSQISQFNAQQANANSQFNAGQSNNMLQFTENLRNNREQFNASMANQIEQSNVQWRRSIATANTAAENAAIATNVQNRFNLSTTAMNNLWQASRDAMEYAFTESENARQRAGNMAIAVFQSQQQLNFANEQSKNEFWQAIGSTVVDVIAGRLGKK